MISVDKASDWLIAKMETIKAEYYRLFMFFFSFWLFRDLCRLAELQKVTQERKLKQHLVTLDWVTQSVEAEKLLPERHFRPVT